MRNFPGGHLMTSGYAPLRVSAIGHGLRKVGPYGREPGRSRMAAARCVLTGTTTAVLTGAAAGALSWTAMTIMTGPTAAVLAVPTTARGPPHRAVSSPRSARRDQRPWPGVTPTPRQNDGPMAATTGPTSPRETFRCTEREDVESQYFTSETRNLVASPSRSRWHPCAEPDP